MGLRRSMTERGGRSGAAAHLPFLTLFLALFVSLAEPVQANSFADLAERLSPAVVNISTTTRFDTGDMQGVPEGSPLEDLFQEFLRRHGSPDGGSRRMESLGSGFVIDADGLIVTNNHVIEGADEIEVNFTDGTTLTATVVGADPKTDIALLKVAPREKLAFVRFGDSDKVRPGDWSLAIGNPFGLGGTVTTGVISATNRDIAQGPYDDFLQTDASINTGNSGGPLFDMAGDVIGINTAIISPTGGSIGIGFATPSAIAMPVIDQLREFGETRRGWLGVSIQTVTPEIAEGLDLTEARGALVAGVSDNGPADKAGIRTGDVILEFDGKHIAEMRDLPRLVAETPVGKSVDVVALRDGRDRRFQVSVGRLEDAEEAQTADADHVENTDEGPAVMGMSLSPLTAVMRERFQVADSIRGVVITAVAPGSPAAEKGLSAGDVLLEVGQRPVRTPEDVIAQIAVQRKAGRQSVLLLVTDGEDKRFVALKP